MYLKTEKRHLACRKNVNCQRNKNTKPFLNRKIFQAKEIYKIRSLCLSYWDFCLSELNGTGSHNGPVVPLYLKREKQPSLQQ